MNRWVTVPSFPHYEIDCVGNVRNKKLKRPLKWHWNQDGVKVVMLRHFGRLYCRSVSKLLTEAFPDGDR